MRKLARLPVPAPRPADESVVADCLDTAHPTLAGRVLARWNDGAGAHEAWLPVLRSVAPREGDRLLVARPANWSEPIVVGVVDGFARRPELVKPAATLSLRADEVVRIADDHGAALVEIAQGEGGPVVRLLQPDVNLELAGELRISAKSVELVARAGEARISASDDVVVRGENVQLN